MNFLMQNEKFDFYSPINLKSYNLDKTIKEQLNILGNLDNVTRKHSENVANLVCRICEYLHCKKDFIVYCTLCAYLHDIGKLMIPSSILQKPAKLTLKEYEIMKKHTTYGYKICMNDKNLKPYSAGALYHHEALNGSGYPNGLFKDEIPYVGQIIRVADEYDAIVSKRQYTTHVNISETLKKLIKDAKPEDVKKEIALDQLNTNYHIGKINIKVLKALFKVVIDDIYYEIDGLYSYINYLESQVKRLKQIDRYKIKMNSSTTEKKKNYYLEGIEILLKKGENLSNYLSIHSEYEHTIFARKDRIDKLYKEISIIKKLQKEQ